MLQSCVSLQCEM